MYPPKFNLRHFMQHLAPGGYYLFQISFLVLFILWIIDPENFASSIIKLNKVNSTALFFGFLIIGVICYFIGVVLRLPSVNEVDRISGKSRLPKKCKKIKKEKSITCEQVIDSTLYEKQNNHCSLQGESENYDSGVKSRKWYREQAAELLVNLAGENFQKIRDGDFSLQESIESKFILSGLWAADKFPYPLWITYTTYLRAGPDRHKEFGESLWPVILETMCNDPKADFYTTVPFNRCKLFILENSEHLASEVYDREAIVRMMAGFYYGLDKGKVISKWIFISTFLFYVIYKLHILEVDWVSRILSYLNWHPPFEGFFHIMFISAVMFLFNMSQLEKVIKNFRHLRMSESETVFSSYLIALSIKENSNKKE